VLTGRKLKEDCRVGSSCFFAYTPLVADGLTEKQKVNKKKRIKRRRKDDQ